MGVRGKGYCAKWVCLLGDCLSAETKEGGEIQLMGAGVVGLAIEMISNLVLYFPIFKAQ